MARILWSREEFMLVMNLYTKIPYGQFHARNTEVIKLSNILNRTPGAVAYKLVHFAGLDPYHKNRGIKGLANPGNNAIKIYNEFQKNWDEMLLESEELLYNYQRIDIRDSFLLQEERIEQNINKLSAKTGKDVERIFKARINQHLFRQVILGNYYHKCSICELNISDLLIASHILKWSENRKERLNPQNGICLCNIHDKAFELGYIGITADYKINLSKRLNKIADKKTFDALFYRHQNNKIILPDKFYPSPLFLEEHYSSCFLT